MSEQNGKRHNEIRIPENAISTTEAIRIARVNMITLKNWCKTEKFIVWKVGGRYWIDPESFRGWLVGFDSSAGRRASNRVRMQVEAKRRTKHA
jgi:hypothetical protein